MLYDEPRDRRLYELTLGAVEAANEAVTAHQTANLYIGSHFNFPSMTRNDAGFPSFTTYGGNNPIDYTGPFGEKRGQFVHIEWADVPHFTDLIAYVMSDTHLRERIGGDWPIGAGNAELRETLARITTSLLPLHILDRARHLFGPTPTADQLTDLYLDVEPAFFLET